MAKPPIIGVQERR